MAHLDGTRVAVLAVDGFEQSEMFEPLDRLEDDGVYVEIVSVNGGSIQGWDVTDWGEDIEVNRTLDEIDPDDYDLILIPGGRISPDVLRLESKAIRFVVELHRRGGLIAAICHAPWLLIEAGLAEGLKLTSFPSIRTDLRNAGAIWQDEPAVIDNNIITAQGPDELDAFIDLIVGELEKLAPEGEQAEYTEDHSDADGEGDGEIHHL